MLTYDMSQRGDCSRYEYLYRCVRHDIEYGAISAGEKLPSKRSLAKHLGVSLVTVESAYAQLVAEGYVRAEERRGYFAEFLPARAATLPTSSFPLVRASPSVCTPLPARTSALPQASPHFPPSSRLSSSSAAHPSERACFSGGFSLASPPSSDCLHAKSCSSKNVSRETSEVPLLADFTSGSMPAGLFPFNAWVKAVREALSYEPENLLLGETPAIGLVRLRRAIAGYLHGFRGMAVDPDCVVVGAGAQVLYNMIVQLLGRNRRYAVEDPGYPRLTSIYRANDASVAHVPLDEGGISVAALRESGASVAHIMPSHQFPTGLVTSAARRFELLEWAASDGSSSCMLDSSRVSASALAPSCSSDGLSSCASDGSPAPAFAPMPACPPDRYLIEDDYDCEFRFSGRPVPSLASIDSCERVIYTNTFTKSLGSAFRIGYMVLPPHLAQRFSSELGFYSCTVSAVDQLALARFIESGTYERHVNRMRKRCRTVKDQLTAALRNSEFGNALGGRLRFEALDSGLHFVMAIDGMDETAFAEAARREGVALAPLSSFRASAQPAASMQPADSAQPARFVMNYTGLAPTAIPAVTSALACALKNL